MSDRHDDLERLQDDLAAYALGASTPAETAEVERHLEGCESCRERLRWLQPAVDALPVSVAQIEPPPQVRERLMAAVREEAAEQAEVGAARNSKARRPAWRDRLGPMLLRPAMGLATVVLLVAAAGAGWLLRGDDAPDSRYIESEALTTTRASATLEVHGESGTLHVHDLPELERNRVYEVWVQRAGVMEPSTTFVLERDGSAAAAIPEPLEGAEGIYVTAEPRGGSRQPTTEPLLTAPLS